MERREYRRVGVTSGNRIPVTFSGDAKGTGILIDLSPGGCKVGCTNTHQLGASLTLQLDVPGHADPVKIDVGVVGWAIKGKYFGVKFMRVEATERLVLINISPAFGHLSSTAYSLLSRTGREESDMS